MTNPYMQPPTALVERAPNEIYQVPPGTSDEVKESFTDALVEDAKTAIAPPEYPPSAPEFYPLMRVPYRRRATAIRKYGELQEFIAAHPDLSDDDEQASEGAAEPDEDAPTDWAGTAEKFELVALLDEFMESVAVDPGAYAAWPDRYETDVFMQTWAAYQGTQPGEASSSSS